MAMAMEQQATEIGVSTVILLVMEIQRQLLVTIHKVITQQQEMDTEPVAVEEVVDSHHNHLLIHIMEARHHTIMELQQLVVKPQQ